MDGTKSETIPTNMRLLLVLERIAEAGVPVTPTSINEELGLPKPTIHRLFATLEEEGFLQRDIDGRTFTPGRRLRVMAGGILSSRRARAARQAIMRQLSDKIGETCNLSIPDIDAMTYLERVETEWPLRIQLATGTKVPFYCTASGKMYLSSMQQSHLLRYLNSVPLEAHTPNTLVAPPALLAEIEDIRHRGYALDREEFMEDMIALAVPINDANGRLFATLSFHAPTQRFDIDRALSHLDDLRHAAGELAQLVDG